MKKKSIHWVFTIIMILVAAALPLMSQGTNHEEHGDHFHLYEIGISTGIVFLQPETETAYGLHMELTVEFEVAFLEIGPALGFSVAGEDTHFTLGIHIGKGF